MTERTLFLEALEIFDPQERHAFLGKACAGNLELRSQVEELIKAHEANGDFMAGPVAARDSEQPGTTIGPYKLLKQIGEGGFGVVFLAEQQWPVRRQVAIKVIKVGMDTRQVVARFEAERQALALMDHPNIAKVFDAGSTRSGRPFFVMELIKGLPITEYCDQHRLTPRERLELFIPVCHAVQHAHQKGVIHRDIKPTNVLVALHERVPVVKVIDFGIAKATGRQLTEKTLSTHFAQMIGTPLYMSPEQAAMNGLDVDTRTDIYSLGMILYELLTGTTPLEKERFRDSNYDEVRRMIREEEPPKPSSRVSTLGDRSATIVIQRQTDSKSLGKLYRGDLDWIVMKALTKDRSGRYATALEFANDIKRYMNDEQVEARPPTLHYRLQKFTQKNRVVVTVFAAVLAVLLIGIATTSWQAIRALRAERNAIDQRDLANDRERDLWRQAYPANMLAAHRALHGGNLEQARDLLARYGPQLGREELRGFEWYYLRNACKSNPSERIAFRAHDVQVFNLAFSSDGRLLATCSADKTARLWDVGSKKLVHTFAGHGNDVNCAIFTRDGRVLLTASDDGTIRTWDNRAGTPLAVLVTISKQDGTNSAPVEISDVALSRDDKILAAACWDGTVRLYDFPSGKQVRVMSAHQRKAEAVAFAADGKTLISAGRDGLIKTWDYSSGQLGSTYKTDGECKSVAAAHKLPLVAIAGYDAKVSVQHLTTDETLLTFADSPMQRVAFSPDDRSLAACDFFGGIWQIDLATEKLLYRTLGSVRTWAVAYSPDGGTLACGSGDGMVTLFRQKTFPPWIAHAGPAAFDADGETIVTVHDGKVHFWDTRSPGQQRKALHLPDRRSKTTLSTDGRTLLALQEDGELQIWDLSLQKERTRIQLNSGVHGWNHAVANKKVVCTGAYNDRTIIRVWDGVTGNQLNRFAEPDLNNCYFWLSADGRQLATIHGEVVCLAGVEARHFVGKGTIRIRDPKSGQVTARLPLPETGSDCFAFCRQGTKHAIGCTDLSIVVDDLDTGQRSAPLLGHDARISCIAFAPDGKTLASSSWDGTVKLWHLATGKELLTLEGHRGRVQGVAFSQDGRLLISWGDPGGELFMWDARDG